jgi:hypothetical protein
MTDRQIIESAAAVGVPLKRLASGLFTVDRTSVLAIMRAPIIEGDPFIVRVCYVSRWRTLGRWKRLSRALKEIKDYVL